MLRRRTKRKRAFSNDPVSGGFDPAGDHRSYDREPAKKVPDQTFLIPIIDRTLVQCARDEEDPYEAPARAGGKRSKYIIHASELGGCTRKAFFSFVNAQQDDVQPSAQAQRWFGNGHAGHRRVQGYLFEAWKRKIGGVTRVWEDVKLSIPSMCMTGELDSVVEIAYRYRYVFEFKTSGKAAFYKLRKASETWETQTHSYMKAMKLTASVVMVECKDNQDLREFWVPFDPNKWAKIEEKCDTLITLARKSLIPKDRDESGCFFCEYKTTCARTKGRIDWATVDEKVKWPR